MVYATYKLFLALYLAHVLTGFVFQANSVVKPQSNGLVFLCTTDSPIVPLSAAIFLPVPSGA
jgi:hypothetical protein